MNDKVTCVSHFHKGLNTFSTAIRKSHHYIHFLYLADVVLHECCGNIDLMTTPRIFPCLLEHVPSCLDALSSATELHVLYKYLHTDNNVCTWIKTIRTSVGWISFFSSSFLYMASALSNFRRDCEKEWGSMYQICYTSLMNVQTSSKSAKAKCSRGLLDSEIVVARSYSIAASSAQRSLNWVFWEKGCASNIKDWLTGHPIYPCLTGPLQI